MWCYAKCKLSYNGSYIRRAPYLSAVSGFTITNILGEIGSSFMGQNFLFGKCCLSSI